MVKELYQAVESCKKEQSKDSLKLKTLIVD